MLSDDDDEFAHLVEVAEQLAKSPDKSSAQSLPTNTATERQVTSTDLFDPTRILGTLGFKVTAENCRKVVQNRRYWSDIQDVTSSMRNWPKYMHLHFLAPHKRMRERFSCSLFLLGNGVEPDLIEELVLSHWDGTALVPDRSYDDNAVKHVRNIVKHHLAKLQTGEWTYYDLVNRRIISWK